MNYLASITDFFKSPKWATNLLLGAVCILIPVVGPLVLIGWHVGALFGARDHRDFVSYPEFDFSNFGKYLERGLWPFLVSLAAAFIMVPLMWIIMIVPIMLIAVVAPEQHGHSSGAGEAVAAVVMVLMFVLIFALIMAANLILRPLMIRAAITQDFAKAFSFKFIKDFLSRVWLETVLSTLFLVVCAPFLIAAGFVVVCVGIYLAAGLMTFIQWHLDRQLYDLYLARGGEPVEMSAKLMDGPPPPPPVLAA